MKEFLLEITKLKRTIRHPVVGRKNFQGSQTQKGAEVAANIYTVIESCKKLELDPKEYILQIIKLIQKGEDFLTPLEYAKKIRT